MSTKPPRPTREERLAEALRDNLARRKALVRAKRVRAGAKGHGVAAPAAAKSPAPAAAKRERDDAPS